MCDNNKYNNIHQYNGDYNDVVCNNSPQYVISDRTVHIQDEGTLNYVVNVIVQSKNNDINLNNDDNAMINANY